MKKHTDEFIAAVWLCDRVVTQRRNYLDGFEKRIGEFPEEISQLIVPQSTSKEEKKEFLKDFFKKIMMSELTPHDALVQKIAVPCFKFHLRNLKENPLRGNQKQILGTAIKYYNQLGYGINFNASKEFIKKTLHQIVDEKLS